MRRHPSGHLTHTLALAPPGLGLVDTAGNRQQPSKDTQSPVEMERAGWGVVYVQKGAEYSSNSEKETYLAVQTETHSVPIFYPICS